MASLNKLPAAPRTSEGAPTARNIGALAQLRRTALACLLWEDNFYEDGQKVADRLRNLVAANDPRDVMSLMLEARTQMHLRHLPLFLARELARTGKLKPMALTEIIQRPDELTEFLALYWADKKQPLSAAVKRGLGMAFYKFNEYSLQKYNRQNQPIKLRDVLRLTHPKPVDNAQSALWKRLLKGELATPDTWEVELSASTNKTASWLRLLTERKLGGLALLRNLRNMQQANIPTAAIASAMAETDFTRVLPFRFIAAARYAPQLEPQLEAALFGRCQSLPKLSGHTAILIDVSGSMSAPLSAKSDMRRIDAAAGLAIIARELSNDIFIAKFASSQQALPPRRGFALRDAIGSASGGTYLGAAMDFINLRSYDRLIVITDEQSADTIPNAQNNKSYIINVGSDQNGVGYRQGYTHLTGFSENIFRYISAIEEPNDH
jgi:60 kDa SS-A/Ro ribonucleoprotein